MSDAPENTFEIGLAMAGAISAGAYSAGVLDFLFQALDEWEEERGKPGLPNHRVGIKVISGASAGAITGALGVVALAKGLSPERWPQSPDEPSSSDTQPYRCVLPSLYKSWVTLPCMVGDGNGMDLLSNHDLQERDTNGALRPRIRSVLNSKLLDGILDEALNAPCKEVKAPANCGSGITYIARELHVYMTVSNLRGVPYSIPMTGGTYNMVSHGDRVHYNIRGLGKWDSPSPWASTDESIKLRVADLGASDSRGDGWRKYGAVALASSAFPVGLAARQVEALADDYSTRKIPVDVSLGRVPPPAWPEPKWPEVWKNQVSPRDFNFLNVDGGLINNEPVEYARFTLMSNPPKPNTYQGAQADRAVIMVDPFPEPPPFLGDNKPPPDLMGVIAALIPALKNQARFKPSELVLACDDNVYSRFLIAPYRNTSNATAERFGIACGLLGGFGGFLDEKFRAHDFQLGRKNCQRFLKEQFTLPPENERIVGWQEEARADQRFKRMCKDNTLEHTIIPLLGSAAKTVKVPAWPQLSHQDFEKLMRRVKQRFKAIVPVLAKSQLSNQLLRHLLPIVANILWERFGSKYIRYTILSDLIRRDQIEGWRFPATLPGAGTAEDARWVLAELAKPSFDFRTCSGIAVSTGLKEEFVGGVLECQDLVWKNDLVAGDAEAQYTLHCRKPWRVWRLPIVKYFYAFIRRPKVG